jgi:predicted metal-dependent hydrolase
VSKKSAKIAALIADYQGQGWDPHYLGYFGCFNRGRFYEAHDVLEELWLAERHGPNGRFYKGLIQLAGAFVHLQKMRLGPAAALLRLARTNLSQYSRRHEGLEAAAVLALIEEWLVRLEGPEAGGNPLTQGSAPRLELPTQA